MQIITNRVLENLFNGKWHDYNKININKNNNNIVHKPSEFYTQSVYALLSLKNRTRIYMVLKSIAYNIFNIRHKAIGSFKRYDCFSSKL